MPFSIWARPIATPINSGIKGGTYANFKPGFIDPGTLKSYYNIDSDVSSTKATQATYQTIGQYYSLSDLTKFRNLFRLQPQAAIDISGHLSDSVCKSNHRTSVEISLDLQCIMAIFSHNKLVYELK